MSRAAPLCSRFPARAALLVGLGLVGIGFGLFGGARPVSAEDAASSGSSYRNASLGVTARSPSGWKMIVDKGAAPTNWKRLVTFNDKETDAQAVLSVRPRTATSVDALLATVRTSWEKSGERLRLDSLKKIDASALDPIGKVIVEGSFTREPKPQPAKDGVAPPPAQPVSYKVEATYLLGPGYEYLLYAQGQRTHWSRLRTPLRQLAASIRFADSERVGAKGEGSYRNEDHGFSCTFPKDYTVITPQRANHVIGFEGVGKSDPVLSIYAFAWDKSADDDAQRLVAHYEEDKGGTVSVKNREVSGQQAVAITAQATIGGVDQTVMLAIFKRGDTCFRLRAAMPRTAAAQGADVFETFLGSFQLLAAPK